MLKLLILGGTQDAKQLAIKLHQAGIKCIYSIAGLVRTPELACELRVGGFGGAEGLAEYLKQEKIAGLVVATHPFAKRISHNAFVACQLAQVPVWRYLRAPWQQSKDDNWSSASDWLQVLEQTKTAKRPFFTLGREPLTHLDRIPEHQYWLVRTAIGRPQKEKNYYLEQTIGPFSLDAEIRLLRQHKIDVLVTKNSGGNAVNAKIDAARILGIPVVMLERPAEPMWPHCFSSITALLAVLIREQDKTASAPVISQARGPKHHSVHL